jgi:hypothetical protein
VQLSAASLYVCRLSAELFVVQEISISVLCLGGIAESKINEVSRSGQVDGRKDTLGSVAYRTAAYMVRAPPSLHYDFGTFLEQAALFSIGDIARHCRKLPQTARYPVIVIAGP